MRNALPAGLAQGHCGRNRHSPGKLYGSLSSEGGDNRREGDRLRRGLEGRRLKGRLHTEARLRSDLH